MKRFRRVFLLAMLGALLITLLTRPKPLDEQLLQLQVAQRMPYFTHELTDQPAAVQALLLAYDGDPVLLAKAQLALIRHPALAPAILQTFGMHATFQEVLRNYGEDVMLPIHYFLTQEILTLEVMRSMSETALSVLNTLRAWKGEDADSPHRGEGRLSGEERAWYAIQFLDEQGYGFIDQFVLTPDGQVAWLQTERLLDAVNRFFASGLTGLETRWRRDQEVTMGDLGWAVMDVAIGVGAFKILRMGRGGPVAGRSLSVSQRSAVMGAGLWRGTVIGARVVKYGAPAVLAYMAVRHPSVMNSLLAKVAEELGLPVALVQWVGWAVLLLPALLLLRFVLGPMAWLAVKIGGLLHWGHRALVKA